MLNGLSALQQRHADYYLALLAEADPHLWGPQQAAWLERLEVEYDNLRAVLAWLWGAGAAPGAGIGHAGAAAVGVAAMRALCVFWYRRGYTSEGRAWVERALVRTEGGAQPRARAEVLWGGGLMAMFQGELLTARRRLEASSAIWRELGDQHGLAFALLILGEVALHQGDERAAVAMLEEAQVLVRAVGDQPFQALVLLRLGDVALAQGDYPTAHTRYEEALTIQREIGDTWTIAQLLNNLGEVARCEGDYGRAGQRYAASLALFRELGETAGRARALHNLGYVAHAQGDAEGAAARFGESLRLFQERGNKRGMAEGLAGVAAVIVGRTAEPEHAARAARLLGAAEAQFQTIGAALWPADQLEYERSVTAARAALSDEVFAAAWAEGRAMTLEQAIAYALEETQDA